MALKPLPIKPAPKDAPAGRWTSDYQPETGSWVPAGRGPTSQLNERTHDE